MRKKSPRRILSPASARLSADEFKLLDEAAALAFTSRANVLREGGLHLARLVLMETNAVKPAH